MGWYSLYCTLLIFILIKRCKKEPLLCREMLKDWISQKCLQIIFYSLIGWTILLQLLYMLFRINILKIIVLVGTFSLAMAFAGNDLVNFIGVPIAGF